MAAGPRTTPLAHSGRYSQSSAVFEMTAAASSLCRMSPLRISVGLDMAVLDAKVSHPPAQNPTPPFGAGQVLRA